MDQPDDTEYMMEMMGVADEDDPVCQIAGCDRPGAVAQKVRGDDPEEPLVKQYICLYHHRRFLAIKVAVVVLVIAFFLLVFFQVV